MIKWRDVASPQELQSFLDQFADSNPVAQQQVLDEMVQFLEEYKVFEISMREVQKDPALYKTSRAKQRVKRYRSA